MECRMVERNRKRGQFQQVFLATSKQGVHFSPLLQLCCIRSSVLGVEPTTLSVAFLMSFDLSACSPLARLNMVNSSTRPA